ncbi:tRNA pseudouridine(55) synthase TruB [Candidatus Uhrbacteria bacterium]|nr:tRNA pseudouridine(55) synthase TruB [Candidatus Uhrbacteria bacterium]
MISKALNNRIVLINKEVGPTSHDIVVRVRKMTGVKRVGHAGTLDPFAEGLLIVLIGRESTKRQSEFLHMDKGYEAVLHFGASSTTDDCTGDITPAKGATPPSQEELESVLHSCIGEHEQLPPAFSAKKIKGKKAYELARKGITPELSRKKITIHSIDLLNYSWPLATIRVHVSSGTYIRALARDIGTTLSCGAYLEKLKRTSIGPYKLEDAINVLSITKDGVSL